MRRGEVLTIQIRKWVTFSFSTRFSPGRHECVYSYGRDRAVREDVVRKTNVRTRAGRQLSVIVGFREDMSRLSFCIRYFGCQTYGRTSKQMHLYSSFFLREFYKAIGEPRVLKEHTRRKWCRSASVCVHLGRTTGVWRCRIDRCLDGCWWTLQR